MFDRQKIILFGTKYIAYLLNAVIILAVVGFIAMFVQTLIQSATS